MKTLDLARMLAEKLDRQPDRYTLDPVGWVDERLKEWTWSKQREIMASVRDHRYTAVQSCHGPGKSHTASRIIAWWIEAHPEFTAFAVSTAPSQTQVEAILWREVGRAHRRGRLSGRLTAGGVPMWKIGNEIVAFGRKPADYRDADQARAAFQGIHAEYILVVLDEASGIPKWLWEAVDSLVTNANARVLAIGNPDNPQSEFAKVCAPGSGWNTISISAFDTPAFTGEYVPGHVAVQLTSKEWVEERKKRWGETSPLYVSKVLGEFPDQADDQLIPFAWIKAAQERDLSALALSDKGTYACDVARSGTAESVIGRMRAGYYRTEWAKVGLNDVMKLAGEVRSRIEPFKKAVPAVIDVIGIGAGVYDRLSEQGDEVVDFNAAARAIRRPDRFLNLRAEQWWQVRQMFDPEFGLVDIDEDDDLLASQLGSMKYWTNSQGRIVIESKQAMEERGLPSPDRADTLMMSTYHSTGIREYVDNRVPVSGLTDDLLERAM